MAPTPGMSATDAQFLRAMTVHQAAAVRLAQQYLANGTANTRSARVADMARSMIASQNGQIATMAGWLRAAGKMPVTKPDEAGAGQPMMAGRS